MPVLRAGGYPTAYRTAAKLYEDWRSGAFKRTETPVRPSPGGWENPEQSNRGNPFTHRHDWQEEGEALERERLGRTPSSPNRGPRIPRVRAMRALRALGFWQDALNTVSTLQAYEKLGPIVSVFPSNWTRDIICAAQPVTCVSSHFNMPGCGNFVMDATGNNVDAPCLTITEWHYTHTTGTHMNSDGVNRWTNSGSGFAIPTVSIGVLPTPGGPAAAVPLPVVLAPYQPQTMTHVSGYGFAPPAPLPRAWEATPGGWEAIAGEKGHRAPGRLHKERKFKMPLAMAFLLRVALGLTEVKDMVDALYNALPKQYRKNGATLQEKSQAVWDHRHELDFGTALRNVVINTIVDELVGRAHGAASKELRRRGFKATRMPGGWQLTMPNWG